MNTHKVQIRVINKKQQMQKVQQASKQKSWCVNSQTETLNTKNVIYNTTEDDLYELFGLCSTKYLKQNYSIKMLLNLNTGKKYFADVTAP